MPANETGWSMSVSDFVRRLSERWPDARTQQHDDELRFELQLVAALSGSLERLGKTQSPSLVIDYGDLRDCAELAHWYRSIVPAQQELLFCDEGMNGRIFLKPDTTPDDILHAFSR